MVRMPPIVCRLFKQTLNPDAVLKTSLAIADMEQQLAHAPT